MFNNAYVNFRNFILNYIYFKSLKVYWWTAFDNFGDALNFWLIEKLTGKKPFWVNPKNYKYNHNLVVGSIIQSGNNNSIVWGSGIISNQEKLDFKPKVIYAVRGPNTRNFLLSQNIECPEVYGDPALILPLIYNPIIKKKFKLGIVAHVHDKNNDWLKNIKDENVNIIDIQNINIESFIDELLSCENICSSSLHGIIVADAYKIPSLWIEFSDKVEGNGFKFTDYFLSVGREDKVSYKIKDSTNINDLIINIPNYKIDIDLYSLLNNCPFKIKKEILKKVQKNV